MNQKNNHEILMTLISMADRGILTGCFADIPVEIYHDKRCPGFSSTQLKGILKKSYKHWELEDGIDTKATRFGTAFHCFVNEPETFVNTYQIIHNKKSAFLEPGKIALMDDDFKTIEVMSKKLFSHPDAGPLLQDAQNELSYFSIDQQTGVLKKCRIDAIKDGKISDLKTTTDASIESFGRDSRKYMTRVSAAYYLEIVSEVLGEHLNTFNLIACEKNEPYEIAVYKVSDISIEKGSSEVRKALGIIQNISENPEKAWRGYDLGIQDIYI